MSSHTKFLILLLSNLILLIHIGAVGTLIAGWLFSEPYYFFYLGVVTVTLLSETLLGYCFLTKWEFDLRKRINPRLHYDYSFFGYYGHKFFQRHVSMVFVRRVALFYLWSSLFLNVPLFITKL